ncbi:hemerythrin-like metal-binding domain-containing protein [Helicobacter didelphidarum]|uniref:Hemerythrin-like metal-binding domain-containing protein n=1 Tax=Helicobacter didelphidarum TaxID=2040648 RepID=A0A3D8IQB4_9HELI|nr:hemerythrin family protein [Helicobacter didelphidarum]RDU67477.1 hemerythrin-like metal-binding domain-containing protein [Helicobacter didelphidarum]
MLPKWSNEYSVHNFLIDEQHKKLFELANIADNMIGRQTEVAEIKKVLMALFEYMKTHFRDEEAYMASIKFPYFETHKEKHREIISEMTLLVKNMKHDFKQQLAIITEQWLLKHILQDDIRIGEYQQEILEQRRKHAKHNQEARDKMLDDSFVESEYSIQSKPENNPNINEAKAINKNSVLHIYSCMCGKVYNISPEIHAKIQKGSKIHCKHCNTNITYINDLKM